jgi:hypothetical protein
MAKKPKAKVKAPRKGGIVRRGETVSKRRATLAFVEKNIGGPEDATRSAGAAAGISGVVAADTPAPPTRSMEEHVGAQIFGSWSRFSGYSSDIAQRKKT